MTGSSRSLSKKKPKKLPGYLHHKGTGQARVRLDGVDHYLGLYGSEQSRIRYGELIAQHAGGNPVDPLAPDADDSSGLTVNELTLAFLRHAKKFYVKNKQPTSELHCFKLAITPLVDLYGFTPVEQFGPLALKAVRSAMEKKGWARKPINRAVARIRHIFRWGVEQELVESKTLVRLEAVFPLQAGRCDAHDNPPRESVSDEHIAKVKAEVSEVVADLIEVQRLVGCRSGELLSLTPAMINRRGEVWIAKLADHKTAHHGQRRFLAIGPKAQLIIKKYLRPKPDEKIFTMLRTAYCRAVTRACERLNIPRWVPHQLRHTTATKVRELFDLDHSQAIMGHSKSKQTEEYAKLAVERATEVALAIG